MKSQKKATKQARQDWALAVREGRVLRFGELTMKSYPTVASCEEAYTAAVADGVPVAKVVS